MDRRPQKYVLSVPDEPFMTKEQVKFLLLEPLRHGWRRELVIRTIQKSDKRADIYYFSPEGVKLRSKREIGQYLLDRGLNTTYSAVYNFSFRQELFGGEFTPYESHRVSKYNGDGCTQESKPQERREIEDCILRPLSVLLPTTTELKCEPCELEKTPSVQPEVSRKLESLIRHNAPADTSCICGGVPHDDMVQCNNDQCAIKWYHLSCVNIAEFPRVAWICPICR